MGSCTDATNTCGRAGRAVLRPEHLDQQMVRATLPVQGPLVGWVEHVWTLAWTGALPRSSTVVIPHPTVHLTVEGGRAGEVRHGHTLPDALLHGVPEGRFAPALPAHGWVVGLHLTPGAVRDLTGTPAHTWTGKVVPWSHAWPGWDFADVWRAQDPLLRARALRDLAERVIGERRPSRDGVRARQVESFVRTHRTVTCVEQVAASMSMSRRQLQRLCRDHLGVTPRWLVRRARVLDAHELLSHTDMTLASIAQHLGWYDQAHFTRDYSSITGVPPARVRGALATDRCR